MKKSFWITRWVLTGMILLGMIWLAGPNGNAQETKNAGDFCVAILPGGSPNAKDAKSPPFSKEVTYDFDGYRMTVRKGESLREYVANVGISFYQAQILEEMGFSVLRLDFQDKDARKGGAIHDLASRQKLIQEGKADISVVNHFHSFGDGQGFTSPRGVGVYIHTDAMAESESLAKSVQGKLVKVGKQRNRGVLQAKFALCDTNATGCKASILIEHAFMTNEQEAEHLFCNPEAWRAYAIATCQGICEYTGVPYTGPEAVEIRVQPSAPSPETIAQEAPPAQETPPAQEEPGVLSGNAPLANGGEGTFQFREIIGKRLNRRNSGQLFTTYQGPGMEYAIGKEGNIGTGFTVTAISKDGRWCRLKQPPFWMEFDKMELKDAPK